jgi:hypothetical protein
VYSDPARMHLDRAGLNYMQSLRYNRGAVMIDKDTTRLHAEVARLIEENGDLLRRLVYAEQQIEQLRANVIEGRRQRRAPT